MISTNILPQSFYTRADTLSIAKELIGKIVVTQINGKRTSGIIVETEAYLYNNDIACHACKFGKTPRTEAMFLEGGHAYVYTCYGVHQLFNVVTNKIEVGDAVLIRAIEPLEGIEHMLKRRQKKVKDHSLTRGPGSLAKALGIGKELNGSSLTHKRLRIHDAIQKTYPIRSGSRIGIEGAGVEAVKKPYRYYVPGNKWVSSPRI